MTKHHNLGLNASELQKPYAKFWNPNIQDLNEEVAEALLRGHQASELGFDLTNSNELLKKGDLALENGYTKLANNQTFVAIKTDMPNVTGKMIDWWFGWHSEESARYKLWHPRAHVRAQIKQSFETQSDLTDKQRYVNNTSFVDEYVGGDIHKLAIQFVEPKVFGLNENGFEDAQVETAVCAKIGFANLPVNFGKLVHLMRTTENGCEMRSRFWLGNMELRGPLRFTPFNWLIRRPFVSAIAQPNNMAHELIVHCTQEMTHLASFLPELYNEYNDKS